MKFRLMVIVVCATFVCPISLLFAQNVEPTETCDGSWKLITTTKVPGSKVALRLSTTKQGQEQLQWPNPKHEGVILHAGKAKAPANSKGEIEICTRGVVLYKESTDSISLRDLQTALKLHSGDYVVRVSFQESGDTSDLVTIQVK